VIPNIRLRLLVQISPSLAGSQQLNSVSLELHEAVFVPPAARCAAQSRWRRENEHVVKKKEGEDLSSKTAWLRIRQARTEMIDCASVSMPGTLRCPVPKL
jgi:hypothetical protein